MCTIGGLNRPTIGRLSTDYRSTVDRQSVDSRPINVSTDIVLNHRYSTDTWPIHDRYLTDTWPILDRYMTDTWPIHDRCLTDTWPIHDRYLTDTWPILDRYMTDTWPIHDRHLTDTWPTLDRYLPCFVHLTLGIKAYLCPFNYDACSLLEMN